VAIPPGSTGNGSTRPIYSYGPTDSAYVQIQNNGIVGAGYWEYFPSPGTAFIPSGSPQTATVQLPAGHWVMIGNPGGFSATVKGADTVYNYDGSAYQATTTLQPGQGAWAISLNGGTATISNWESGSAYRGAMASRNPLPVRLLAGRVGVRHDLQAEETGLVEDMPVWAKTRWRFGVLVSNWTPIGSEVEVFIEARAKVSDSVS
jgi:hypothetical protein